MAKVEKLIKKQAELERKITAAHSNDRGPLLTRRTALDESIRLALGGNLTLEFMKKHAINPDGEGHTYNRNVQLTTATGGTITQTVKMMDWENEANTQNDAQVKFAEYTTGQKKVAWAVLSKRPGAANSYNLTVSPTQPNEAGAFEVYYLPWKKDMVLRMQIPTMGQGLQGHDPSIFFTAAINGCSVFIEGTQQSPTIYHAGTERTLGAAGGRYWRRLFEEYSNTNPQGAKNYSEVKADQYVNLKSKAGRDDDIANTLANLPQGVKQTRESLAFKDWLGQNQKDLTVTDTVPYGCVFGFRDNNGDWTFYLQKNVTVAYYTFKRKFGLVGPRVQGATLKRVNMPMEIVQVFPGRAHVRMSGFSKVASALST